MFIGYLGTTITRKLKREAAIKLWEAARFDGRKNKTVIARKEGQELYLRTILKEHYVLVQQLGDHYIGHISDKSASAHSVASAIIEFISSGNLKSEDLVTVEHDETPVNTGRK